MDGSAEPMERRDEREAPTRQESKRGRGIGDTQTGDSVSPDSKGGTGDRGCDDDPQHTPATEV
jgi:hypothetical protein